MFNTVVKLTVNQRVQGLTQEQATFRDLLMCLRTGDCTENDWNRLSSRQLSMVKDVVEFTDAIRLYYSYEEVANYNS